MKCFKCNNTLEDGPLFRQNENGVTGVWACSEHNGVQDQQLGEVVADIAESLNGAVRFLND